MRSSTPPRLVLAGRKSDLARVQVYLVAGALRQAFPEIEIVTVFRDSLGDKNLSDPLWRMPEKGVFTEDFVADLVDGRADVVVHSWKDLPMEPREKTRVAATLPRADARDVLLFRRDCMAVVAESGRLRLLSSSPRRAFNLASFLKYALPFDVHEIQFDPVRGNVPTRLRKLLTGEADGLIVAKAALDRLLAKGAELQDVRGALRNGIDRCLWMVLPLKANPTAPAQGALALEIARARNDLAELLAAINDNDSYRCAEEERRLLAAYGGGCHQKIGVSVLDRSYGRIVSLRGEIENGEPLNRYELIPSRPSPPSVTLGDVWPLVPSPDAFFERELLAPAPPAATDGLWVAKSFALPTSWPIRPDQIVWAAGLETWRRLARRGVWVHGSAEGLGEEEPPAMDVLAGRSVSWLKLTHEGGHPGPYPLLPTYRLIAKFTTAALGGKTHYYWSSGSGFLRALSLHPGIRSGWHACGPGNTFRIVSRALDGDSRVRVHLDHASWLAAVTAGGAETVGP